MELEDCLVVARVPANLRPVGTPSTAIRPAADRQLAIADAPDIPID